MTEMFEKLHLSELSGANALNFPAKSTIHFAMSAIFESPSRHFNRFVLSRVL